jgi:HAD superfamily hydrolase (TIGR01549 family)
MLSGNLGAQSTGTAEPTHRRGLPNPLDRNRLIRAVLFDLDGTLYRQTAIRMCMAIELLTLPLAGPLRAPRRWRALSEYRKAQERLRLAGRRGSLAREQVSAAASAAGLPIAEVQSLVDEWLQTRPLKYLRWFRAAGLANLLQFLEASGIPTGVLSDYPAQSKLHALGLTGRFSPVLSSTDLEVGVFKPNPGGFLRACKLWQLAPSEVLMVGDRPDVDAAGAAAAGMPCVIIGRSGRLRRTRPTYLLLPSLERLHRVLDTYR